MKKSIPLVALALSLIAGDLAGASDWLRFRGPNGRGIAESENLPIELSAATAKWRQDVVFGRSSPIVAGGRIYLTGADGDDLVTAAYRASDGRPLWRRAVQRLRVDEIAEEAGPAAATPVSDGSNVYSFFPEFGLVSYDRSGHERWRLELPAFSSYYGLASSPVLEGGVLVLVCDQSRDPYVIGVETETGRELWRQARDVRAESWTTPVVYRSGTEDAVVLTFGALVVDAYQPRTGEHAWRLPGFGFVPVSSPIVGGDTLYVVAPDQMEGSAPPSLDSFAALDGDGDGGLSAAEMAGSAWESTFLWLDMDGDGTAALDEIARQLEGMQSPDHGLVAVDLAAENGPRIRWRSQKTLPYIASPILYRGVLFLVKDGGILTSYDPGSGEVLKRGRIEGAVEPFFPSPVATDGRLYLSSSVGTIAVVSAEAQWRTLAQNDLDEQIFASPAIADGHLIIRTRSTLYAFGPAD